MSYLNFVHRNKRYHLQSYGDGERVMLVFPGFGQSTSVLEGVSILSNYRVVVIHPDFNDETAIKKGDLKEVIQMYLVSNGIKEFDLLGFSIGSKPALMIWNDFKDCIGKVILLAPESLKENVIYKIATQTSFGKAVFKFLVTKPQLLKFPLLFIGKKRMRILYRLWSRNSQLVYNTWMTYRRLGLGSQEIKHLLLAENVTVVISQNEDLPINRGIKKACEKSTISPTEVAVKHQELLHWFFQSGQVNLF